MGMSTLEEEIIDLKRIRAAAIMVCVAAKASDDDPSAPDLHAAIAELEELL